VGGDEIYLDLIDEMSPGVIKLKDPGFTYVLMPMRIS
jgi:DNA polymerase-3 subunit beta